MLGRHVYRVHPDGEEWTVTRDGEDRARANFDNREQAVAEAMRLAQADQPAKIRIDNDDGSIAEERLIGHELSDDLKA
jgi:YD repeat-containing protein